MESIFKLKHLEFFCGKIPVKIYFDKYSGIHFVSIEAPSTNLTDVSVSYVTYPYPNGIPNVTAQLALRGTDTGLSADRFDHHLGNAFSANSLDIQVEPSFTSFSFDLIGGTSGYIQLLNLLLDNLSNPTFGERDFRHQICDVNELSGKLYENLQKTENRLQNTVDRARISRSFYGTTHANDHIGTTEDLRSKTSLSKALHYFNTFYQNPWILLTEKLDSELDLNLLDTLSMKQSYSTKHKKSIVQNYSLLIESNSIKDIPFHYSDVVTVSGSYESDNKGIIQIGFLAESPTNVTFMEAIEVLSEYLCDSKFSYLNSTLASGSDAICSSISIELKVAPRCEVVVQLNNVPKRHLNKGAVEKFFDSLEKIRWDQQLLQEIVMKKIKHFSELTEGNINKIIFDRLRIFQLYSDTNDSLLLKRLLNPIHVLYEINQLSTIYWQKFVAKLFVSNCSVVIGVPDNTSTKRLLLEHKLKSPAVMMDRKRKLRRSTELLKEIYKPSDSLYSQEIVDIASAQIYPYHKIFPTVLKSYHWDVSGPKQNLLPEWFKCIKSLIDPSVPFMTIVHPVEPSDFVQAVFVFDLKGVELKLRYYVLIFMRLLFSSASFINGNFMSSTEVIRMMGNEVLERSCQLGFDGNDRNILRLSFKVTASKLELIEKCFHASLCNIVFDVDDVARTVCELIRLGQDARNNGIRFCNTLLNSVNLEIDNEDLFLDEIVLESFHYNLLELLMNEKHQQIMDDLNLLRNQILNSSINLHLVCDPKKLASTHQLNFDDLKRFRLHDKIEKITIKPKTRLNWPKNPEIHVVANKEPHALGYLVERIPFECQPFDENHAAVLVFCNYFSSQGGIFWRCIHEDGQAKNTKFEYDVQKQILTLVVESAKNLKSTRQLVTCLLRQMFIESIDSELFKASKRGLAAKIIGPYSNVKSASLASIRDDIHTFTVDQITSFVHKILVLKESQCQKSMYDLIFRLNSERDLKAISCPAYQISNLSASFQNILHPNTILQHSNDSKKFELLTNSAII